MPACLLSCVCGQLEVGLGFGTLVSDGEGRVQVHFTYCPPTSPAAAPPASADKVRKEEEASEARQADRLAGRLAKAAHRRTGSMDACLQVGGHKQLDVAKVLQSPRWVRH